MSRTSPLHPPDPLVSKGKQLASNANSNLGILPPLVVVLCRPSEQSETHLHEEDPLAVECTSRPSGGHLAMAQRTKVFIGEEPEAVESNSRLNGDNRRTGESLGNVPEAVESNSRLREPPATYRAVWSVH